ALSCSWTSSWCDSGRLWACSSEPSNAMDSRCESFLARVLQQCRPYEENGQIRIVIMISDHPVVISLVNDLDHALTPPQNLSPYHSLDYFFQEA
ncbi:hypothetical protein, partial [Pseudodonghicola xiamenensis]|uniref:hypothetical protein n=1 Tax=Pseudodonghicola xiamenensis TaxID=337702 RepID=UPI001E63144E